MALTLADYPQLDGTSIYGNALQIFFQTLCPLAFIFFSHDQDNSGTALCHAGIMDDLSYASYDLLPLFGEFELNSVCTREAIPLVRSLKECSISPLFFVHHSFTWSSSERASRASEGKERNKAAVRQPNIIFIGSVFRGL